MSLRSRIASAWNAFLNRDPTDYDPDWSFKVEQPTVYSYRPDRPHFSNGRDRSIITAVLNRIAVDCSQTPIRHARVDDNDHFLDYIPDDLNEIFKTEANIDQTGEAFVQDIVMSLLDEGYVACVPIDTDINTTTHEIFKIYTMRTGRILQWYPNAIQVEVYNDRRGVKEQIIVPKQTTAIIENPFYAVFNEPNSTFQRLIKAFNQLDVIDEQNASGKLDLIIQLPYVVKTEQRKLQAEQRRKDIEKQLTGSKYGIAYTDGTEKITQLNRPVENQIMSRVEFLTSMLYSQLGMTKEIMEGSAKEEEFNNYYCRTVEPILSSITKEFRRKFLSKTARTQGQSVIYVRDAFKLLPVSNFAELADKFTRNEIMSANEIRMAMGMKPSEQPGADDLRNKNNIATPMEEAPEGEMPEEPTEEELQQSMNDMDAVDADIAEMEEMLKQADANGGRIITARET
ncbi:MAG: phage portal protein [Clostridiales bacterium]|nr:phage portal protein [Clostridiales bacterium]